MLPTAAQTPLRTHPPGSSIFVRPIPRVDHEFRPDARPSQESYNRESDLQYIDIQTGGISEYRNKMQDIDTTRMRANGRGRAVAMRLRTETVLAGHSFEEV